MRVCVYVYVCECWSVVTIATCCWGGFRPLKGPASAVALAEATSTCQTWERGGGGRGGRGGGGGGRGRGRGGGGGGGESTERGGVREERRKDLRRGHSRKTGQKDGK